AIDQKRTEEALSESERMHRTLFDNAGDAIFVHDMGRVFLDVNAAACERYGYKRDEFLKMAPADLVTPDRQGRAAERVEAIRKSGQVITETDHIDRDGKPLPCELNSRLIEYKGNPAVLSVARDLTERKRADEERRQMASRLENARKMEAIGTLAGGVAHDLNNILSGLVSYPELLLMDLPEDSPMREGILLIQKSGNRAAAIVQDLLTLARRGVVVTDIVDINRIITDHLESPEHKALRRHHPHIDMNVDPGVDLFKIKGSSVHLSKTVMNLVSNAAEAMADGGVISLSTRNRYLDTPVKGYDHVRPGEYVTLTVSDQGTGIDPADMERIFEPFYTKKVMGRSGTGLGMAVVWGTVKDHDGYIDIRTAEDRGSAFTLYFPITRKEPVVEASDISMEDFMGRGETIVAVDDVEEQRLILSKMLTMLHYSAQTFSSGEEAVEYMQAHSADLLILDMLMYPGIDGLETYKRIIELHPGQKAIIVSGFSENERVLEARRLGAGAHVKKPY
ncbi:MAG: PAS domain S-box protein, partial [Desulfobacterales bacterium]|nr:PAS domain S-box protein [Desulfobacterales bacterium]